MGLRRNEPEGVDADERLLEMEPALARRGLQALTAMFVVAVSTSPWLGWSSVVVAGAVLAYWFVYLGPMQRWLGVRHRMMANLVVFNAALAVNLATSGGPQSPVLPIVAVVPAAVVMMFPRDPLLVFGSPIVAVLLGAVATHPVATVENPVSVVVSLAAALLVPFLILEGIALEFIHRQRALIDSLTGCLNRHALDQRIPELEAQCQVTGAPIGVVAIDVDHFKSVNDEAGHAVGDQVLQELGYACRKEVGHFGLLYRVGGEEFVVLLPGGDAEACHIVAERLRRRVEALRPDNRLVTISCGTASQTGRGVELSALIASADAALYRAKAEGRNRTVAAPPGPTDPSGVGRERRKRVERRSAA